MNEILELIERLNLQCPCREGECSCLYGMASDALESQAEEIDCLQSAARISADVNTNIRKQDEDRISLLAGEIERLIFDLSAARQIIDEEAIDSAQVILERDELRTLADTASKELLSTTFEMGAEIERLKEAGKSQVVAWIVLFENCEKECNALLRRVSELEKERNELRAQIAGFPNLQMIRQAMVDTAAENDELRAEVNYWKLFANAQIALRNAAREELRADAKRYRLLRRGQHWSIFDGIGDVLRAEELDAAIDVAMQKGE